MKPAQFDYLVATTVEHALASLGADGEAKLLAGGQSLVPILNFRLARPTKLIDINRLAGLAYIHDSGDQIRVGALTRHFAVETSPIIARHVPVVSAAMSHVAHLAIRNRGTIAGSLAHADPAAEWPMLACLLDAEIALQSISGARVEPAQRFFRAALTTSLAPDEMIVEVRLPKLRAGEGWAFEEVARRHGDFALAAAAATIVQRDGRVAAAHLALIGVGDRPTRMPAVEALLTDQSIDTGLLTKVDATVRDGIDPNTDLHASADYRRHLAGVLAARVVATAWRRSAEGAR